jgi:hypothetical protein
LVGSFHHGMFFTVSTAAILTPSCSYRLLPQETLAQRCGVRF